MKIALVVIMGLFGLSAGYFVPLFAHKAVAYKYAGKQQDVVQHVDTSRLLLKAVNAVFYSVGWAMIAFYCKSVLSAVLLCLLWAMAALITVIDLKVHKIPNEAVLIVAVLGIIFQLSCFGILGLFYAFLSMIAVMVLCITLVEMMGFQSFGAGDVKLAGAMGLSLGYPHILQGLISMSILLILFCLIGMLFKKLTLKSMLPFAPFMMAGMSAAIIGILIGA